MFYFINEAICNLVVIISIQERFQSRKKIILNIQMYIHVHDFEMLFFFLLFFTSARGGGSISLFWIDTFLGNLFPIKRPLWDKLSTRNHSQVMMLVGDLYNSTSWSGKLVGFNKHLCCLVFTELCQVVHFVKAGDAISGIKASPLNPFCSNNYRVLEHVRF